MAEEIINQNINTEGGEPENKPETKPESKPENKKENNDELISKLGDIVEKKTSQIIRSILKDNGIEDKGEMDDIIDKFSKSKNKKQEDDKEKFTNLEKEHEALKKQFKASTIKNALTVKASELGISTKNLSYIYKLADLSKVEIKDGQVDDESLTAAINAVLEDVPVLKTVNDTDNKKGFKNIGPDSKDDDKDDDLEKMRKFMGL